MWKYVFNFADACVCVGGAILMLWLICSINSDEKKEREKKRLAKAAEGAPVDVTVEDTSTVTVETVEEVAPEATAETADEKSENSVAETEK